MEKEVLAGLENAALQRHISDLRGVKLFYINELRHEPNEAYSPLKIANKKSLKTTPLTF